MILYHSVGANSVRLFIYTSLQYVFVSFRRGDLLSPVARRTLPVACYLCMF